MIRIEINKLIKENYKIILFILIAVNISSCKKAWLDEKPEKNLVVPSSIEDFQALIDNSLGEVNGAPMNAGYSILDEFGAGDVTLSDQSWKSLGALQRNSYIWAKDLYAGDENYSEWSIPFQRIFYTNVILEGLDDLSKLEDQRAAADIKGAAYFHRAFSYYNLAQLFCKPYDIQNSNTELGLPLRTTSDFNEISTRSTVQETYDLIIEDLHHAQSLMSGQLPNSKLYKLRPTVAAADALLARVYLVMSNYDSALYYADKCLNKYAELIDYNSIAVTPAPISFSMYNPEVIFHIDGNTWFGLITFIFNVNPVLFNMYEENDLRKKLFFNSGTTVKYKGSYGGSPLKLFCGLATDEIYLIRSESYARKGAVSEAMTDLNVLLSKRWKSNTPFIPVKATDQNDAINKVLLERRKELCYRGLRWSDLRRLNLEVSRAVTLTKTVESKNISLPPNHNNYVLPIPPTVIAITSMEQNVRN